MGSWAQHRSWPLMSPREERQPSQPCRWQSPGPAAPPPPRAARQWMDGGLQDRGLCTWWAPCKPGGWTLCSIPKKTRQKYSGNTAQLGSKCPQLEHLSSLQTTRMPPLVPILTRPGLPGAATPEALNTAQQRRGHELSWKNVLLGPPQAPFPITKVSQASGGMGRGWRAATGFPSGDHEEARVGAGSPLCLVCCLSPAPNPYHPRRQGWKLWNWKGWPGPPCGMWRLTGASCMCGGWSIKLCVQMFEVQEYTARGQTFLWIWVFLNPTCGTHCSFKKYLQNGYCVGSVFLSL